MTGPLKLAIVGGGPSAWYVASRLLQQLPAARDLRIHIYDRLWAPHGLVRYGVAPDHPEVKNCTHKFDEAASDPRVRFFGNVHLSETPAPYPPPPHVPHALSLAFKTLFPYYTHLVLATGASLPRLHPALPRSSICVPALDLVHWYTKHPSAHTSQPSSPAALVASNPLAPLPDSPVPHGVTHITLIGHGNVSLDIARLLLTPPSALSQLDIPEHVLAELRRTWDTLKHVSIVGRRGPREAKFTAKEVREMMRLKEAGMVPIPESVLDDAEKGEVYGGVPMSRQEGRIMKLLREGSATATTGARKTFSLEFWRNPTGYTSLPDGGGAMLALEDTRLDPMTGRAVSTGGKNSVRTDLIVTSLGYEGDPAMFAEHGDSAAQSAAVDGHGTLAVDKDEVLTTNGQSGLGNFKSTLNDSSNTHWLDPSTGQIRNAVGRVLTPQNRVVRNVYAAGWAGRGARGVLAGTLLDAGELVRTVVGDWGVQGNGELGEGMVAGKGAGAGEVEVLSSDPIGGLDSVPVAVEQGLRECTVLEYQGWRKVDEEERRKGAEKGKERERMAWGEVAVFCGLRRGEV